MVSSYLDTTYVTATFGGLSRWIVAALILPILIPVALKLLFRRPQTEAEKVCKPKPKFWRINGIPATVTEADFRSQLGEPSIEHVDDESLREMSNFQLTLVRRTQGNWCAIVTSALRPRLEGMQYTVDSNFFGILPSLSA